MKIIINNTGEIVEVNQREADRLINRGKAHPTKVDQTIKIIPDKAIEAELVYDGIEEVTIKPKVKVIKKQSRKKKSKFRKWND